MSKFNYKDVMSQMGVSFQELPEKVQRKIEQLEKLLSSKLRTIRDAEGNLKPNSQIKADDLNEDIVDAVTDIANEREYESAKERKAAEQEAAKKAESEALRKAEAEAQAKQLAEEEAAKKAQSEKEREAKEKADREAESKAKAEEEAMAKGGGITRAMIDQVKAVLAENNGEIKRVDLIKIIGREPSYPRQVVGDMTLKKGFLSGKYKV